MGALPAAIAAATYGLVAGCVIGGPVGTLLIWRDGLHRPAAKVVSAVPPIEAVPEIRKASDLAVMYATILVAVAIGLGTLLVNGLKDLGITLPAYLGPCWWR